MTSNDMIKAYQKRHKTNDEIDEDIIHLLEIGYIAYNPINDGLSLTDIGYLFRAEPQGRA